MKLFLIKCGKVINAFKHDGFYNGIKKVSGAVVATGKCLWVPAGDILIITSGVGDSARYRAHHVAEELRLQGFRVSVTVQDNPFLARYAKKFSVFIFHRVLYLGSAKKLYDVVKEDGRTIIFETDDLVHDPKYLKYMDFYQQMQRFEKLQYKDGVGGKMIRDPYIKIATTTTTFLADKLREEGKEVFIVPNALSQEDVQWVEEIIKYRPQRRNNIITIGYFSGVISHNKDFATIIPALEKLFEKYAQLRVVIYGPLDIDDRMLPYQERFIQNKYAPRREHFMNVASVDINIAPLELGNPFCEAKSELKFFEAGIVSVPTVAAATQTFCEAITDGEDGFTATTTDEWVEKLAQLIEDADLRKEIGKKARETVLKNYTTKNTSNKKYYTFLREKILTK